MKRRYLFCRIILVPSDINKMPSKTRIESYSPKIL